MQYAALTQQTCEWLLGHQSVFNALHDVIISGDDESLREAEFAQGPLRLAGVSDKKLVAIWNTEYLSGVGEESWGIFRIDGPMGIKSVPQISHQVLERIVFVINRRLQGLVLDTELIHRAWPNGSHTCLAGRGTESRQYSISYFEGAPGFDGLSARAILCIGPEHDFKRLQSQIDIEIPHLASLCAIANKLTDSKIPRPLLDSPSLAELRAALTPQESGRAKLQDVTIAAEAPAERRMTLSPYETLHWSYDEWINSAVLNEVQRRVLESDALFKHPIRIIGPAGSGKTLLMQLLAIRYLARARERKEEISILYVVHNSAMAQLVLDRFRTLDAEEFLTSPNQRLTVSTLAEYGRNWIGISENMVIDKDAQRTKEFQLEQIRGSLRAALEDNENVVLKSALLSQVRKNDNLFTIFAPLVMAEISTAIKGRGLVNDEKRYVNSELPFSRLHRILTPPERSVIYDAFRRYNHAIFEEYQLLDSDDLALSLAGRLQTPIWQLKRKTEGFDFVFVDEAQLFNENERRVFAYLTKGERPHVPIALALDQAQEPFGFSAGGLAAIGIEGIENEALPSNHRSTQEIVDLAFFVIQKTTDLFGADFPEFKKVAVGLSPAQKALAAPPVIVTCNEEARNYGRFVLNLVKKLRARNIRQIAVICHADSYWDVLRGEFRASQLPLHILVQRGEKLTPDQPLVVLSRPPFIGGQEFDAVVLVGLEQGLVPPRVMDNAPLAAAIEQQVLREMYLAISRARIRVIFSLNNGAAPNSTLQEAESAHLVSRGQIE